MSPSLSIAFNRPECNCRPYNAARPIDLDHLARQTMGQKDLEAEVLRLFLRQARECMRAITANGASERSNVAHMLCGSARGVGAFAVADHAKALELAPGDQNALKALSEAVVDVENFLLRLAR